MSCQYTENRYVLSPMYPQGHERINLNTKQFHTDLKQRLNKYINFGIDAHKYVTDITNNNLRFQYPFVFFLRANNPVGIVPKDVIHSGID